MADSQEQLLAEIRNVAAETLDEVSAIRTLAQESLLPNRSVSADVADLIEKLVTATAGVCRVQRN